MTTNTPEGSGIVEQIACNLSIPQHHTTWDLLTTFEKDLYYQQAEYVLPFITTLEGRLAAVEAENGRLREALEPFAELASNQVFEKFAEESKMTFVLCRPSDHKRFAFLNAECLIAAAAVLGTPTNSDTGAS